MKSVFRLFFVVFVAVAAACGYVVYRLNQPYKQFSDTVFIDFPIRTRTEEMARLLADKGVIERPWLFTASRVLSPHSVLQAGEYKFAEPSSALEVFARIAKGDTFYQVLTVPEGHNIFDIAQDLKPLKLIAPENFLQTAGNPALIRDLDESAPSLEGYLFPDSYRINKRTTAESLCRTMTGRFREEWKQMRTVQSAHDVVTLASMIEREAKLPQERPRIASVFANRLKIGMKLDCDPTTVYAALIEHRYRGKIYRSDLESTNAYNTYKNAGLPPGPIANPGLSSLKAALAPASTDYLYFVAKGDGSGGHAFSQNLVGHLAATALLRAAQNARAR